MMIRSELLLLVLTWCVITLSSVSANIRLGVSEDKSNAELQQQYANITELKPQSIESDTELESELDNPNWRYNADKLQIERLFANGVYTKKEYEAALEELNQSQSEVVGDESLTSVSQSEDVGDVSFTSEVRLSTAPPTAPPTTPPTNPPTTPPTRETPQPSLRPTTSQPSLRPTTSHPSLRPTTSQPSLRPTTSHPSLRPTTS